MRNSIDGIGRDFTHALHALRRRPQVAIVTILTVGLAVGASTAIFSIVNAILIQPPPYRDAGRLAMLWNLNERIGYTLDDVTSRRGESMSPAEFLEWKKNAKIFDRMAAFDTRDYLLTGTDRPEMILGYVLAEGSFQTLGIQPMYGRLPTLEEERGTAIHVVLLRYDFWRRAYQSDPTVVGRTIQFNGVDHRILGILPPKFTLFSRACDFLSTLPFDERSLRNPYRGLRIIARLKPKMTIREAQSRADQFSLDMARRFPVTNTNWHVRLLSVKDDTTGKLQPAMVVLLGAIASVLLIMCANIANLLLAQGSQRAREFAVRVALGARRGHLVRQSLSESLLLSLAGGALGLILAFVLVDYLQLLVPERRSLKFLLQADSIAVDWRVVLFALGTALLTGLLFGAIPAMRASAPNVIEDLKDAVRGSTGRRGKGIRQALIVIQVTLGLVLVVGAALLVRSFAALYERGPGFRSQGLLSLRVTLPVSDFIKELREENLSGPDAARTFRSRVERINATLLTDLGSIPGVRQVAATSSVLNIGAWFEPAPFSIEGRTAEFDTPMATPDSVTPNFFSTMGIPLQRGRGFTPMDRPGSQPVVIINDELARRYFLKGDPIGRRIKPGLPESRTPWQTIIGVVGSIRQGGMDKAASPAYYFNQAEVLQSSTVVLRTGGKPLALLPEVRRVVHLLNPAIPEVQARDMTDVVRDSTWQLNYSMLLLGGLAVLALLLTVLGVYSIVSYSVEERTQEIGVRVALGADAKAIMSLILRQNLVLVGIGIGFGLLAAIGLTRFLSALLFGITALDGPMFGLSAVILAIAGILAACLPASRATQIEPTEALRHQ